jgi:hypothetical protein
MPYCGKHFWTHQIPTSCLPTLLIFIHIEHICSFFVAFFSATFDGRNLIFCHKLHIGTPYRSRQTGSRNLMGPKMLPTIWHTYMKLVTKYQIPVINSCWEKCDKKCAYMFNVYKNQQNRQTGSRNLMSPKTLHTIWGTYMKLVTKNQISAIKSCWEKCDEKWAYMFNVYKNQQSRQTGSRNLTSPKTLPTIWYTYLYPRSPKGGILFYLCPSVRLSFRPILPSVQDIFLSNCWWQKSDIWSQASYRYTILWVAFLDSSDSFCHQQLLRRISWTDGRIGRKDRRTDGQR